MNNTDFPEYGRQCELNTPWRSTTAPRWWSATATALSLSLAAEPPLKFIPTK